jgi:1-aminocyclopropane-1-carboxylate deaminase/D-cysteine desulfhydrase-like pyridoxal-dependent ACC family enzyme
VPELLSQLEDAGVAARYLYLATGSAGTHSGVLAGLTAAGQSLAVQGISVGRDSAQQEEKVLALSNATLQYMEVPGRVSEEQINVDDRYRGPGYGHPTLETMEAVEIAAREEALILDPVYTGKAMAGLIGHAREGRFSSRDTVVFLHTGGAPALFAYSREVIDALEPGRA